MEKMVTRPTIRPKSGVKFLLKRNSSRLRKLLVKLPPSFCPLCSFVLHFFPFMNYLMHFNFYSVKRKSPPASMYPMERVTLNYLADSAPATYLLVLSSFF
ncbi:hypothetical protein RND81_02G017700 [Saponaria officinalis]|uniref:Uncharacterized protein n=1 Tax=Saponaria officinalis TaxID=3572 RepID=A0AAW1MPL6_SAPOF